MSGRADARPEGLELRTLGGRYRLVRRLGRGGMAEVHLAHDQVLGRDVAVKILLPELAADPSLRQRFRREARAAASLNHPNIVAVHDTGVEDDVPFMIMECVRGRSLAVLLSDGGVTRERALEICAEVCSALEHAHAKGIVHLDVKPGNVLIAEEADEPHLPARTSDEPRTDDPPARASSTARGTVKVADFGIARAAGSDTLTTTSILGTASYLSPEQARGEAVDGRSDLYSLGVVLYELTTGQVPFRGGSPLQVALRHVADPPPPPSELTDLHPALEAVILKALAKDPAERHQTAREFRAELIALPAGPTEAGAPTAPLPPTTIPVPPGLGADFAAVEHAGIPGARRGADSATAGATSPLDLSAVAPPRDDQVRKTGSAGRHRSRRFAFLTLGVLTVAAVVLLALSGALGRATVPAVAGLAEDDAVRRLEAEGLTPSIAVRVSSVTVPAGRVISSDPAEGTEVEDRHRVALTVSAGPPPPPVSAPRPPAADAGRIDDGDRANGDEEQAEDAQDRAEDEQDEVEDRAEEDRGRDDRRGEDESRR